MNRLNRLAGALMFCLAAPGVLALDLARKEDQLAAYIKLRGDLAGQETFADFHIDVYGVLPGERPQLLFKLDGFNVGKFVKDGERWLFLSRELALYRDAKTGGVLERWSNPYTGQENAVVQVQNDPVNQAYDLASPRLAFKFDDYASELLFKVDVPLRYPNPLPPQQFPEESGGAFYSGMESFTFFADKAQVHDASKTSAATRYVWFRYGPWLPWMKMGERAGFLLYTGHGRKHADFAALDAVLREAVDKQYPLYRHAPQTLVSPNETSWTFYRKLKAGAPPEGKGKP